MNIMKEKIRAKMEAHIKTILEKPIITDQEYMLIAGYLSKLEAEEQAEASRKSLEDSQARLRAMMGFIGGDKNGL